MKRLPFLSLLLLVVLTPLAHAGVTVEVVPDDPGPYFGGESLGLDVWLYSEWPEDVWFRLVQLDFTDTDPALDLDPAFMFDYSSLFFGDAGWVEGSDDLPVPWTENTLLVAHPAYFLALPAGGSLHIGSIGLGLPDEDGTYRLDVLNADEPDPTFGATLGFFVGPVEEWRAYEGHITGGTYDFVVIPEPASLCFISIAALFLLRRRQG
jgi:hypothetical protein